MTENITLHLAKRPTGEVIPGETFETRRGPAPTREQLQDGQILVEVLYMSLDPALRPRLADRRSYLPPLQIGDIPPSASVSRVLASRSGSVSEGDLVMANPGWTQYAILSEGEFEPQSRFPDLQQPTDMLSGLGVTGVTAWYGMQRIGEPKAGETVVVSGAAGATGSAAGQIAKIAGAYVVGIAGGKDKCRWLTEELGFDVALDYKDPDFKDKLKEATPNYIDVYFDNVGGEILDLCLARANVRARFVQCGSISMYNATKPHGIRNIMYVITMRIRMEGFIILEHRHLFPEARRDLSAWMRAGKLRSRETIVRGGLPAAEQGLVDLFRGVNTGKLLVEVKNPNQALTKL